MALDFQDSEAIDASVSVGQYSTENPPEYLDPDFSLWRNPD